VSVARGAALGLLGLAVVLVVALLLRGEGTHEYHLLFQNAGQLVKDDDVQIGGRRVGNVRKIELTRDNQARITIGVQDGFAPLHEGTSAIIRATSLSGIANRYIALTPGPDNAPELDDGATLTAAKTTAPVDLDQLFNTLDPKSRRALDQVIQGSAQWYDGRGKDANKGSKYFNPALSTTSRLVNEIVSDQKAFTDFVVDSSQVVTALAARRDDLSDLVTNANRTTQAIGSENVALARALGLLPGTLRKANTTFVNLRATLSDLDTLVAASKPATKRLAPFLEQLRPLVADARPTIADLRKLVRKAGKGNDLTDLLRQTPGLEKAAKPTFADTVEAFRKSTPVLDFIRPYTPDLIGWVRDFGQGASNYDANGHFARIQPIFNAFSNNANVLVPTTTAQRLPGMFSGQYERCPGAATQPAADGSSPYRDSSGKLDCDPRQVPAGR
jgi:phospholipid/cholesterol/gamma-HCH transport system substrate-binding protein